MCEFPTALHVPELNMTLYVGNRISLGRFEQTSWIVCYGWYAWGGNREVCGWFLRNASDSNDIKPLQRSDLIDVYIIEL